MFQAMQKLNEVREKVNATNEAFVAARKRAHKAKLAFEKVSNHTIIFSLQYCRNC